VQPGCIEHASCAPRWRSLYDRAIRDVTEQRRQVLFCDEQGLPEAILEIDRDITGRRAAEQAVHLAYTSTTFSFTLPLVAGGDSGPLSIAAR
jgi:hypothetical protein